VSKNEQNYFPAQERSIKFLNEMVKSPKYAEYRELVAPNLIDFSPHEFYGRGSNMNLLGRIIADVHYGIVFELEQSKLLNYNKDIYKEMFLNYCAQNNLLGIKALARYMTKPTLEEGLILLKARRGYNKVSVEYLEHCIAQAQF